MVLSRLRAMKLKGTLVITPNVYQLTARGVNVILIVEEELTLVDTGFRGGTAQLMDFIHSLGRSVEEVGLIIITHNHLDHAGGLAELRQITRAKVAAHKAEISGIERHPSYPPIIQRALQVPLFSVLDPVLSLQADDVDIQLEGGEVLEPLGGLQVIHTPGHSPGSISLFSPRNRLLIVGDALNRGGNIPRLPPKMVSSDLRQAVDSVKRLARLDIDILCFGHGRPLVGDVSSKMQRLLDKVKY